MPNDEIIDLLTAYVNGTITDDDRARVEKAAQADKHLQQELDFLAALRGSLQHEAVESPGQWGWKRLQRDIRREKRPNRIARSVWKISAVAAVLVLVVQTAYFMQIPDTTQYQTLSGPINEENLLQLRLRPDARQEEVLELLLAIDAEIVSGPSAIGLYHIVVKDVDAALAVLETSDIITYVNRE
ncbi:MAG: hypothetical protein OEN22_03290 [Gammaproteobacteria bacterium]|nr:hypothetical protein [Gammaproteobacteria bacterium]